MGFNPRLPLPGGEAVACRRRSGPPRVSIHASRCREAKPFASLSYSGSCRFQSTPPVAGRRSPAESVNRPLSLVSIHASRCREAKRTASPTMPGAPLFQSTPPVAGRRSTKQRIGPATWGVFQSTPPVAGRRSSNTQPLH